MDNIQELRVSLCHGQGSCVYLPIHLKELVTRVRDVG